MKENTLDKGLRSFTNLSFLLLSFFFMMLAFTAQIYTNSSILIVDYVMILLMTAITAVMLLIMWMVMSIFYAYNKKYVSRALYWPLKVGLDIFLPLIVSLSIFLKYNKEHVRLFYVKVNNIVVESYSRKLEPEKILILLPHCIQYSECKHRITNRLDNCKKCGMCPIGNIVNLREDTGVQVAVVTGGTAALNTVSKQRPELIMAVACERELASGIADVRGIPVIAVLNDRPNGPCYNTLVDISTLRETLDNIIAKDQVEAETAPIN